ncbi:hypothetical protein HALLA_05460 [Halostagnicola larsenii XH-48]|uniref:Uncharacterized protein n=1 Tax=Halostagnicola larsenii XH-48 TaxID=797299 RepID=W0JIH8_9EURY|nr:hypothetical protein [Halostagnicola larsenii]AHF98408.1 hypothetical protein HALLA_05460 [Halostagnicola larsenii XH-48]
MIDTSGSIEVETLLKVVLALLAVWLVLSIVGRVVNWLQALLPILLLGTIILIVLWLLDIV